jgi:hypothetical protein
MPNQELKEKAMKFLDVLASLRETYGSDEIAKELTYFERATPQELMKDLGISEEEAKKVIEVTKSMIAIFRL